MSEDLSALIEDWNASSDCSQVVSPLGRIYASVEVFETIRINESIPVELLHLLLISEIARRSFVGTGITILIDGGNLLKVSEVEESELMRVAERERELIFNIIESIGVPDCQVLLLPEIEAGLKGDPLFSDISNHDEDEESTALLTRALLIEYLRIKANVKVKVGQSSRPPRSYGYRFDDRTVDNLYKTLFPEAKDLIFLYAKPYRTGKLDVPPQLPSESLDHKEHVNQIAGNGPGLEPKTVSSGFPKTMAQLSGANIITAWENLTGNVVEGASTEDKLHRLVKSFGP